MKKMLTLLLATVMALSLFACATPPAAPGGPNGDGDVNQNVDLSPVVFPLAEQQTLKISMYSVEGFEDVQAMMAANLYWQDIIERTNIKFEFNLWNTQNVAMQVQAGEMGDLIMVCGQDKQFQGFIADGAMMPIDAYVNSKEIMPNVNKLFEDMPSAKALSTAGDGHIYMLGAADAMKANSLEYPLWINKKWLDQANLPVPTTFAELEAALDYFANHDMNGNGDMDDEVPIYIATLANCGLECLLSMWGIACKDGQFDEYVYLEDGKVKFVPTTDVYKDFIKKMNEWYEKGYFWSGIFSEYEDKAHPLFKADYAGDVRVGVLPTNQIANTRNAEDYVLLMPPAAKEGVEVQYYVNPGVLGSKGFFCVPKTSTNPKLACAFADIFYGIEYAIRGLNGEEGSIWRVDNADGTFTPVLPDAATQESVKFTSGNVFNKATGLPNANWPYYKSAEYYEKVKLTAQQNMIVEAYEAYEEAGILCEEIWPRVNYTKADTKRYNEIRADLHTMVNDKRAKWISGANDIDAEWEDYKADLGAMGLYELVDIMQRGYDTYAAAIG